MSFETRYKNALDEARRVAPSSQEIGVAARRFAEGSSQHGSFRLARIWGLTVTAGLAVGVFTLAPSKASGLDALSQALASVPASHTVTRSPSGKKTMEFWREGVKRRYVFDLGAASVKGRESHVFDRGYDGTNVWSISTSASRPTRATISEEAPTGFGDPGTSIEQMINSLKSLVKKPLTVTEESLKQDGVEYKQVVVEGVTAHDNKPFLNVFRCRKSDGLPLHGDYYVVEKGVRKLTAMMDVDYPTDLPDDTFAFKPPAGVRIADMRIAKRAILAGMKGENGTQTVGGVSVRLLGAFEQPNGMTYILWSGGATPHIDGRPSVKDGSGSSLSVSALYQMEKDPSSTSASKRAVDARVSDHRPVPIGHLQTKPLIINHFMRFGGKPIYALLVEPKNLDKRSFSEGTVLASAVDSSRGHMLDIEIPVFKKAAPRTLRYGTKGAWFQSDGMPVGTAHFKVETIPVDYLLPFAQKLGIEGSSSWAGFSFNAK